MSRNTLREALRSLENAGLLRLQKGATGGAFVRESTGDADNHRAARHVPSRRDSAGASDRGARDDRIDRGAHRVRAGDAGGYRGAQREHRVRRSARFATRIDFYDQAAIHLEFHRIIARATKNPVMVIVMDALLDVMQHFIRAIGQKRNPWVLPSRRRFMKHFEAGDSDGAVTEMEQHLERLNRHYLSLMKEKDRAEAAGA